MSIEPVSKPRRVFQVALGAKNVKSAGAAAFIFFLAQKYKKGGRISTP